MAIVSFIFLFELEKTLRKLWKNLRDGFTKCMKRWEEMTRSGAGESKLPICKLFTELSFIRGSVANRATDSNFDSLADDSFLDDAASPASTSSQSFIPLPVKVTNFITRPSTAKKRRKGAENIAEPPINYEAAIVEKLNNKLSANAHFLLSLEPALERLPARLNQRAGIEIQQVLFRLEFGDDD